ncbi:hypothetical protein Tco_0002891 [Tanacetum coccineum]
MKCRYLSSRIEPVHVHPDSEILYKSAWVLNYDMRTSISSRIDGQSESDIQHTRRHASSCFYRFWKRDVSPRKGDIRFGKLGKLNPRYIGPFKILEWIGPLAYKLELPEELSNIHSTFYVSNLKKCLSDKFLVIPMKELRLDDKLNFVEEPVEIMDREVKQLKQSRIPIVKVRWNSKRGPEFMWVRENPIHAKYPHLFSNITLASN